MKLFALKAAIFATNVLHVSTSATPAKRDNGLICGQRGWSTQTDSYWALGQPDYLDCYQWCQQGATDQDGHPMTCSSFSYPPDDSNGRCQLYTVNATSNFVADDSSPYVFYDLGCDRAMPQCGMQGYSTIKSNAVYSSGPTTQVDSPASCAAYCNSYNKVFINCFSYAWDTAGAGDCVVFTSYVNDHVRAEPSFWQFYDYYCDPNAVAASSTSTTDSGVTSITDAAPTATTDSTDGSNSTDQPTSTDASSADTTPTDASSTDASPTDAGTAGSTATDTGSTDAAATDGSNISQRRARHHHFGHGQR